MPAVHDLVCDDCEMHFPNHLFARISDVAHPRIHIPCGGNLSITYPSGIRSIPSQWHPKDAVVVFEDPKTGEVVYPGRNDVPMPERYASRGFERKEMRNLRDVEKFERKHKVVNAAMHFDSDRGLDS